MNPAFQCGYQTAKIWHRNGIEFKYRHPRDDYERGWNVYVARREWWKEFRAVSAIWVAILFIAVLIYVVLLLT